MKDKDDEKSFEDLYDSVHHYLESEHGEDYLSDPSAVPSPEIEAYEPIQLGERIRRVRQDQGLSLEDLEAKTGIVTETLRRIEGNEVIPPLGELIKLGKALDKRMAYFLMKGPGRPFTIVRAEHRPTTQRYGKEKDTRLGYFFESLAAEKANRFMEPFIVTLIPVDIDELSSHDGQEFIFVLEGEMEVRLGEYSDILKPGDAIYYDSSTPHLVKCRGEKETKILAVLYTESK